MEVCTRQLPTDLTVEIKITNKNQRFNSRSQGAGEFSHGLVTQGSEVMTQVYLKLLVSQWSEVYDKYI